MKKRILSMLLAVVMLLGMFPGVASAADSVEEALGEVDIYNGGQKLSYLSINGRVRTLIYTYYNYVDRNGNTKEIPAYCVNPNTVGVPQTVAEGESITPDDKLYWRIIAEAMKSSANICIIPVQDYLGLDNNARMNQPSTLSSNWSWRMKDGALTDALQEEILTLTKRYGRFNWDSVEGA